jgi:hypothetical protein
LDIVFRPEAEDEALEARQNEQDLVNSADPSQASTTLRPIGEFMTPLPLTRECVREAAPVAGCYLIYLEDRPYYAGMSVTNMRRRLSAHAVGRGSRMVRAMLANGRAMYFECCAVDPFFFAHEREDVVRAESWFMLLHTGEPLPGNLRLDGLSLVGSRDPIPPARS